MPARSTTHRSRFLAGLSARLGEEQTLRDHADAPDWEEPAAADEPAPRELQDGSERDARGQAFSPPSPWSEAGMPKRLREAIASVRRVSHHMAHELPPLGAQPVYEGPALDDEASHEARSFEADTIRDQPPFDDEIHEQPSFDDDAIDDEPLRNDDLREESPFDADAIDDARRYGGLREEPPYETEAIEEEPPLDDEMQEQRSFEAEAVEDELPFGDDAIDERFEGSAPVGPARGSWEDSEDRLPVRRRAAPRRGLHVAAFAVATAFVVGAGLGLGLVYGGWGAGSPPVAPNAAVVAAIEPPAASSAPVARPPEPTPPQPQPRPTQVVIQEQPTQVVIREMPPLPAAPVSEAPPSAEAPKDLPLPPPPKPSFRQVATSDAPPADDRLARPADDRLARPADDRLASEADEPGSDSLEEGLGGPFQPLFVKLTASRVAPTQVLLHYPAGAAGAPATAMHLVRHLKAEGFRVEPRAVDFPIPTTSIRYFADADRGRAESVRASLEGQIPGGAALPILDFTHFEPKPQAGHLEIWLSL